MKVVALALYFGTFFALAWVLVRWRVRVARILASQIHPWERRRD